MTRDTVITVAVALTAVLVIGASATTMEAAVSTDPGDVIEFDEVPLGETLQEEYLGTPDAAGEETGERDRAPPRRNSATDHAGDTGDSDPNDASPTDVSGGGDEERSPPERSTSSQATEQTESAAETDTEGGAGDGAAGGQTSEADGSGDAGDQQTDEAESESDDDPPADALLAWLREFVPFLIAVLIAGGLTGLAVRYRSHMIDARANSSETPGGDRSTAGTDSSGLGREPANPVEEAWSILIAELEVEQLGTRSTADLAEMAIEAGYDPDAVWTLTRAFEEVAYGGRPVTEDRTERAEQSLQRLRQDRRSQ